MPLLHFFQQGMNHDILTQYIKEITELYESGKATEHSYRPALQRLVEHLLPQLHITNEPRRQRCGAPDYIISKNEIPVGFIEVKDIGDKDLLGKKENKEQFDRYKASLGNIIFSDYLSFYLYRDGELVMQTHIAELENKKIVPQLENFQQFQHLIQEFGTTVEQTIKNPKQLAQMMANKAKLLADVIEKALLDDNNEAQNSSLKQQMIAFDQMLIKDIQPKAFADIYAQTIAYGMFAARFHDKDLFTFSRQKAAELIPKSNPFLRKLFAYIAGVDIDDRIKWIVDTLADIFKYTDVGAILQDYGKGTQQEDPIIHFYETFLSEYDPKERKSRGVWYTPKPVVNFIVRAVDDLLKTEFDLPKGLADTSKTCIKLKAKGEEKEFHKIQILDPATGTGTFLAEVVKLIHQSFKGQQGIWENYVTEHLLPRLNGFELLMASYAMAHLQLDLLLKDTGYDVSQIHTSKAIHDGQANRFRIFLTNSLEEYHDTIQQLGFVEWLSTEANQANQVKRDTPVMCIIGNPPYSGESANKGKWITQLMEDYKKEPNSNQRLNERNPKWINDDYVKFLRFGQYLIEKNGTGILAYINPHGFLDNPTFRGMRWNLLKTYDKIYTIDLHGNSKKKETSPDGSPDANVFDIMQGVSINLFVKTGKKKPDALGKVFHYDLYGKREYKYDFLNKNSIKTVPYKKIPNIAPDYFFVSKDFEAKKIYDEGLAIHQLFPVNSVGIVTANDELYIDERKDTLTTKIKNKYGSINSSLIRSILYRPFDTRFLYNNVDLIERSRIKVMQHFLKGKNIGLISIRRSRKQKQWTELFCTHSIISGATAISALDINYAFPLYLYPDEAMSLENGKRIPNLNPTIVKQIAEGLGLFFTEEKETRKNTFAPIDILDYIYAVLYSPKYRDTYKEFLKIDFPRVPYPKDKASFGKLVALGSELRQLHVLEHPLVAEFITQYPISGSNEIEKLQYINSRVCINATQYFDHVPEVAWQFYIGGYQPAQKWLKDRKGRALSFEDIQHYQKIIVALTHTHLLMQKIDAIGVV